MALCSRFRTSQGLDDGGGLPRTQPRLVLAWAELHEQELLADWQALQAARQPAEIDPLR